MRKTLRACALETAYSWADRGTCPKKKVGACVTTATGRVVATGYNGAPGGMPHCDEVGCELNAAGDCARAMHAEANALMVAGHQAKGGQLYTTHFPCPACAMMAVAAGIRAIHYDIERPDDATRVATVKLLQGTGVLLLGPQPDPQKPGITVMV